jgi:hypothetical protein
MTAALPLASSFRDLKPPSLDRHASALLPQIGYSRPPSFDNHHRTNSHACVIENRLLHGEREERTLNEHNALLQEEQATNPESSAPWPQSFSPTKLRDSLPSIHQL